MENKYRRLNRFEECLCYHPKIKPINYIFPDGSHVNMMYCESCSGLSRWSIEDQTGQNVIHSPADSQQEKINKELEEQIEYLRKENKDLLDEMEQREKRMKDILTGEQNLEETGLEIFNEEIVEEDTVENKEAASEKDINKTYTSRLIRFLKREKIVFGLLFLTPIITTSMWETDIQTIVTTASIVAVVLTVVFLTRRDS